MSELPFRKILRETVQENPNYGSDMVWMQTGPSELEFNLVGTDDLDPDTFPEKYRVVIQQAFKQAGVGRYLVVVRSDALPHLSLEEVRAELLAHPKVLKVETGVLKNEVRQMHVPRDDRKFLFDRENIELECDNCGKKVRVDDLESDSHDDPDYSAYSDKVCPHCGVWDCVDWTDEKLSDKELQRQADENSGTCVGAAKLRHLPHD